MFLLTCLPHHERLLPKTVSENKSILPKVASCSYFITVIIKSDEYILSGYFAQYYSLQFCTFSWRWCDSFIIMEKLYSAIFHIIYFYHLLIGAWHLYHFSKAYHYNLELPAKSNESSHVEWRIRQSRMEIKYLKISLCWWLNHIKREAKSAVLQYILFNYLIKWSKRL